MLSTTNKMQKESEGKELSLPRALLQSAQKWADLDGVPSHFAFQLTKKKEERGHNVKISYPLFSLANIQST